MTERHPHPPAPVDPDRYAEVAAALEAEIGAVIVGQHDLVRDALCCLLAEGHLLIEGVPGLGKTQLVLALSSVVGLDSGRIQFTPDLMPADIVGTQVLESDATGARSFRFAAGPVFTNLLLADEVNRATPKTQSALLEAMQERRVTAGGDTRDLPRPFLVLATQNPIDQEGTYPLPEAQLDRFMLKSRVGMPTVDELVSIIERTTGSSSPRCSQVAGTDEILSMIELTRSVPVPSHVVRYAAELVLATHPGEGSHPLVDRYVRFGASPRGAAGAAARGEGDGVARRPSLGGDRRCARRGARGAAPPCRAGIRSCRRRGRQRSAGVGTARIGGDRVGRGLIR